MYKFSKKFGCISKVPWDSDGLKRIELCSSTLGIILTENRAAKSAKMPGFCSLFIGHGRSQRHQGGVVSKLPKSSFYPL